MTFCNIFKLLVVLPHCRRGEAFSPQGPPPRKGIEGRPGRKNKIVQPSPS